MFRRQQSDQDGGVSQLSFVQTDSDEDEKRPPILPSSSRKGSGKKQRQSSGTSIRPGAAIQTISRIDGDSSESTTLPRASTSNDRDRTPFSFYKATAAKKHAPQKAKPASSKHPLPPSKKNKQQQKESVGKPIAKDPPRPAESQNPTQDMEVPYAINLGIEGDENLIMACALSDCPKEPLNPGDVIHYFHPAFAAGSEQSVRVTQVIATDPSKVDFPLELDNGEMIPRDTRMRRLKEYDNGKLYNHPGIFRDLENFRMKKRSLSSVERKMLPNARQKTMDLLNDILEKANEKLENLPSEIMNMNSPTSFSQQKRKASSEPQSDDDSDSSSSSSDSSSSDDSLPASKSPRQVMSMASRFSIETQQNRKHLSPSNQLHKEEKAPQQPIHDDSKSPKHLVLKNLGGLKRNHKTGQKENAKQEEGGFSVQRKELTTSEKARRADKESSSDESEKPLKQNTVIDLSTRDSSKGTTITSTAERRPTKKLPNESREASKGNASLKRKVYDLSSSDSDDDSDEDLKHPVFSGGPSKYHGDIVAKSKTSLSATDCTRSTAKPTPKSSVSAKETPRWSLGSVDKKDKADDLWDSCESDNDDSTRISAVKKRRIIKASPSQSTITSRDPSVAQSRRKKIKDSAFLPSELETQDSSCASNYRDFASEKEDWEEYLPKYLNKRTPQPESQDEDIDGFSSQETPGDRSRAWGSRPFSRKKHTVSSSTLKLKPISNNDRF